MKKLLFTCLVLFNSLSAFSLTISEYRKKPKLIVVLVIDQFRSDFLTKYEQTFLSSKNKKEITGFNYLMENSAYFPNAEYNVLQSMTCPGHAMILTGAYPHDNGIVLNEWFDKTLNRRVYCAEDEKFKFSPRRLLSSTVGDELKNVNKNSRVFSLALKDRSSIMLGGHRANLALWIDNEEAKWVSSTFYTDEVPSYVKDENKYLEEKYKFVKTNSKEVKKDLATYLGVKVTVDMATSLIKNEKLGLGSATDMLAISFSTHDMTGHTNGPDSLEVKAITHIEDREISRLLNVIKNQLGSLDDVMVVLTADHGVAPNVETSIQNKFESGKVDYEEIYKNINQHLDQKFGKAGKNWIQGYKSFHLYIDSTILTDKKLNKSEVELEIKSVLKKMTGIRDVILSTDIEKNIFPIGEIGEQLKRQYNSNVSGDIIIVPLPFYMEKDDNCVTHMTGYSYDRTVPLLISGRNIKNGIYAGANIIDLAPTLSHILGVLPPTLSSGKVLEKILR